MVVLHFEQVTSAEASWASTRVEVPEGLDGAVSMGLGELVCTIKSEQMECDIPGMSKVAHPQLGDKKNLRTLWHVGAAQSPSCSGHADLENFRNSCPEIAKFCVFLIGGCIK